MLREESERVMELKTQEKQPCSNLRDTDQKYYNTEFPGDIKDRNLAGTKAKKCDDLVAFCADKSTFACQSPECHFKSTVGDEYKQHMERAHGWTHIKANPLDDLYSPETTISSHLPRVVDDDEELDAIADTLGHMKIDERYHGQPPRTQQHPLRRQYTQECENSRIPDRHVSDSMPAVVVCSSYNYSRPAMETIKILKRDYLQDLDLRKENYKTDGFKIEVLKRLEREGLM